MDSKHQMLLMLSAMAVLSEDQQIPGMESLLPNADCDNCEYTRIPHEDGHCYMFMDAPDNGKCGQFEPRSKR